MNRREALKGADYVLAAIRVGGGQAGRADKDITMKYGRRRKRWVIQSALSASSSVYAMHRLSWTSAAIWQNYARMLY